MRRVLSARCSAEARSGVRLASLALAIVFGSINAARASSRLDRLTSQGVEIGVWLTNSPSELYYDRGRIREAIQRLAEAGFTRVIPNVWSRGTTFHRSHFAPTEPALAGGVRLDPICTLAAEGRRGDQGDALV